MKNIFRRVLTGSVALILSFSMLISGGIFSETVFAGVETDTIPNTTRTIEKFDNSFLSVTGFASGKVNDRTEYIDSDKYRTVSNETEFVKAIDAASRGEVKVIEITQDLDLGYVGLPEEAKQYSCIKEYGQASHVGVSNPAIMQSGVSQLYLAGIDGLTIFSKSGVTVRRAEWKLQGSSKDIIVRNIKFDGMWQWSEAGSTKETGWSLMKVNGAKGVWFDHCSFTIATDGNCDSENGAAGLTYSWCTFGMESVENPAQDSTLYQNVLYMEYQYQHNLLSTDGRYYNMRKGGATVGQILAYEAYHSKAFLIGSGDKDYKDDESQNLQDGNQRLEVTMAYNWMRNLGQRVIRLRQGKGHLFNCYVDYMGHYKASKASSSISSYGGWNLYRCMDIHNGGSAAADTCVFNGVQSVVLGRERLADSKDGLTEWGIRFQKAYNHTLVVNSKITKPDGSTYTGSSWDNGGNNLFIDSYSWYDHSTVGKFAWSSHIVGVEDMVRLAPPTLEELPNGNFDIEYDYNEKLPYTYKVVALDNVESTVKKYSGAYTYSADPQFWLKTSYDSSYVIDPVSSSTKVDVTKIEGNFSENRVSIGDAIQLITNVIPSNATDKHLTFTSSDEKVASVTDSGLIIGNAAGKAVITAKSANGIEYKVDVTVFKKVTSITLDSKSKTVYTDATAKLTANVAPEDATNKELIWKSSSEAVATVSADGVITPVAPGNTTITCMSADDNSIQATCKISVKQGTGTPVPSQTIEPTQTPSVELLTGDADGDKLVTAKDALCVLKHAARLDVITDANVLKAVDIDNNSVIDAQDALAILKIAAKLQ